MTNDSSIMNQRLQAAKESQDPVAVYLSNGVKLVGKVESFDSDSIQLTSNIDGGVTVERHSVSAVQKNQERKGDSEQRNR